MLAAYAPDTRKQDGQGCGSARSIAGAGKSNAKCRLLRHHRRGERTWDADMQRDPRKQIDTDAAASKLKVFCNAIKYRQAACCTECCGKASAHALV